MSRTQAERSNDSRQRILDAAVTCLVERGYAGTTTLTIQKAAAVSRGRLLHHFRSKDQLLVAAAQHLADSRLRETEHQAAAEPPGLDDGRRMDRAVELTWATYQEPHFWASVELWTAARTNPELAAALLPAERRLGAAIRDTMIRLWPPAATQHPAFPQVRDLLLTSMRGVALTYAFDRRRPSSDPHVRQWQAVARSLLGEAPPEQWEAAYLSGNRQA